MAERRTSAWSSAGSMGGAGSVAGVEGKKTDELSEWLLGSAGEETSPPVEAESPPGRQPASSRHHTSSGARKRKWKRNVFIGASLKESGRRLKRPPDFDRFAD